SKYNLNEYSAVLNYKKGKVLANFTLAHQPHREHPRASEITTKKAVILTITASLSVTPTGFKPVTA
ncbi:MAG: hypothetical protein IIX20_05510, partial [Alistipes sp.]|nr:hypothetical protein [Alistipes sp.]